MAAITQRIPNLLGGVSTQPDSKKLPGQVREAVNVYPDPALGLVKRPGFKFLTALHNGSGTNYTTPFFSNAKWFYINRDDDEIYIGCIKGAASNGDIHIWNATPDSNGAYVKATVNYTGSARNYLTALASDDYQVLTVQDTSIVVNKKKVVTARSGPSFTANSVGTVLIKAVEYSSTYKVIVNGTDYQYQTYNADTFSTDTATDTKLNADTILTGLKSAIDAASISGLTVTKGSNCLELSRTSSFTLDAEGGSTGTALESFQDEVETFTDLPATAQHGRVVKIFNTNSGASTFYAKFFANKGSGIGDGYWEETIGPGVSPGLTNSTMPHELVNTGLNTFTFKEITYTDRLAGDLETNSNPTFVDKTINGAFFNSNRLGFLTGENVSMSQAGEFFNFFFITATTAAASDPVDLACSSTRPLQLHAALPSPSGVLLFSQSQQFLMYSQSGTLSPQDAVITGMSNYETDQKISPVEVGTSVFFVSKTPSWSRVFSYTLQGLQTPPQVIDIAQVVSQYIPSSVTQMISSPQNSFVAMYGESDRNVYMFKFYNTGQGTVMQSWFKWELPGYPLSINVEQDVIYAVIQAGNKYILSSLNISSSTDESILISSDGRRVSPFIDFYAPASSVTSITGGSRINLPYNDISGLDPVMLVKGDGVDFDSITDSGFTAPVTKVVDGSSTYFFVEGKDLSAQAADVIVGYKFGYDIELPTFYYQPTPDGSRSDYNAYLLLNRLTISCGDIANFGLKIKTKGVRGQSFTFTGDGSTTSFALPFTPRDRRDIAIQINQSLTEAFTITTDGVITFTTAPSNNSTIVAFEDYVLLEDVAAKYNTYLADDVSIDELSFLTFPVNQRNKNVEIRIFSDSPFPLSVVSMVWEGQYSPKFIRRA